MLLFRREATYLIFSVLFSLLLFSSCDRENPTENIDDGEAPAKPRGLSIFREVDGEVGLEWTQNLEKDIDHYNLYRKTNSSQKFVKLDSTSSLFYIDVGLNYDSIYNYKITAVDFFGLESKFSDTVSATPKNYYRPYAPYYLYINAKNWNDQLTIKISFSPSFSSDVSYYEIHKSEIEGFEPDSTSLIAEIDSLTYIDTSGLSLLTNYYYKLISVDKGGLKSDASKEISDLLLDPPSGIFPSENSDVDYFTEFKVMTCSHPADYKLVLQSNEIYGTEIEINFSSDKINQIISVPVRNVTYDAYEDYFWRVLAYTKSNNIPNSFSKLNKFRIVPDN